MDTTITVKIETRNKLMGLKYKLKLDNIDNLISILIKEFEKNGK